MRTLSECTILVVDDTPANIDVLVGALGGEVEVAVALDGQSAIELIELNPPDLILLDIMMPEIDGYEVCERLKANPSTEDIPVIFLTALSEIESKTRGFELGAVDYITKPFQVREVRSRVNTHLSLKLAREELENQNTILEVRVAERTLQVRQAFKKLKDASLETIIRLSRAAEYKDDDTGAHVLRLGEYASAVARAMNMSKEDANNLLHATPLHDIGKIGIPDRILTKPGKLDAEEWVVMKTHSEMGAKILEGSDAEVIQLGEVIAMTHHEKWDGTGYPKGLRGGAIPLESRIVALVDVFDALTTKRPYKDPFPIEKALGIIREGRGSHFDPDVVDAFFGIENKILEIRKRFLRESLHSMLRSGSWKMTGE